MEERGIEALTHSSRCQNANCPRPNCQYMKGVVQHMRACSQTFSGRCPICTDYMSLIYCHGKHCRQAECLIPICFKRNIRQQKLQKRLQRSQLLKRWDMSRTTPTGSVLPGAVIPVNLVITSQMGQLQMQENQSGVMPVGAPTTNDENMMRNKQALQQLMLTLQLPQSVEQRQQILSILRANPDLIAAFIKEREAQQLRRMLSDTFGTTPTTGSVLPGINNGQISGEGVQPEVLGALIPVNQITTSQMGQSQMPANHSEVKPGSELVTFSENMRQRQALQRLMLTLQLPRSVEQEQQILSILEANPQLMATFIKHRQEWLMQPALGNGTPSQDQLQSVLTEMFHHLTLE